MKSKKIITRKLHKLDATNLTMGRLASRIAALLRGKHKVGFSPEKDLGDRVLVANVRNLRFTGNKLVKKIYYQHSLHPGGITQKNLQQKFQENPAQLLRKVVYDMLPKNKLRKVLIKRLQVE